MAIHIIRADLSNLPFHVDFIVNTANPKPKSGGGLDKSIYGRAEESMLEERKKIGEIAPGDIAITEAHGLNAKKVIHAVAVAWNDGFHDELTCVKKCYHKSLAAAVTYMNNNSLLSVSIAMPLIGTGIYQIPLEEAIPIAISESVQFALKENIEIYLVLFSEASVSAMKRLFPVEEYIAYNSSRQILDAEYTIDQVPQRPENIHATIVASDYYQSSLQPKNFVYLLNYYMEKRKIKSSEIYSPISLTRQAFSDISSGKKIPKKETAILIALRLKLSFDELEEFLSKAGHSLSDDKEEDRLVKEFFQKKCYDVQEYQDQRDKLASDKK